MKQCFCKLCFSRVARSHKAYVTNIAGFMGHRRFPLNHIYCCDYECTSGDIYTAIPNPEESDYTSVLERGACGGSVAPGRC
jgi:hypothetical protein